MTTLIRNLKCITCDFIHTHTHIHTHIHTHCERISPIELINTSITSYIYLLWGWVMRTFKFYSFRNIQLYNTVFSTIVTVLYMRSSDLIHLIAEVCSLLPTYFPYPLAPWQPLFSSVSMHLTFFFKDSTYK